jgi:sterol desaturase/sphingolipid hydroxylase (fatty acid hydroxylase superfamily)
MDEKTFLVLTAGTQIAFLAADVVNARRAAPRSGERLRPASILFLAAVILVYGAIQVAGLALVPEVDRVLSWANRTLPQVTLVDLSSVTVPTAAWLAAGVLLFYVAGFWDYLTHRFASHSRALFFTHEYHHLPNRLFLALPGLSVRPFAVVATLPALLGTVFSLALGLRLTNLGSVDAMPLVYVVVFAHTVILAVTHSEFFVGLRWMQPAMSRLGLTSPQEHELHHTVDLRGNYGNFTLVWDRLFGTYLDPNRPENQSHPLGLGYDRDYLGAITAGHLSLPKSVRDRFQVGHFCNLREDK